MSNCIFCKIANGEMDATVVYENDDVIAFEDTNPKAPYHTLVIPRKHIDNLDSLTEKDAGLVGALLLAIGEVARKQSFARDGYRVVFNINDDGGQTVNHLHAHILGGRRLNWPPG